jgi:hypothetical protein
MTFTGAEGHPQMYYPTGVRRSGATVNYWLPNCPERDQVKVVVKSSYRRKAESGVYHHRRTTRPNCVLVDRARIEAWFRATGWPNPSMCAAACCKGANRDPEEKGEAQLADVGSAEQAAAASCLAAAATAYSVIAEAGPSPVRESSPGLEPLPLSEEGLAGGGHSPVRGPSPGPESPLLSEEGGGSRSADLPPVPLSGAEALLPEGEPSSRDASPELSGDGRSAVRDPSPGQSLHPRSGGLGYAGLIEHFPMCSDDRGDGDDIDSEATESDEVGD